MCSVLTKRVGSSKGLKPLWMLNSDDDNLNASETPQFLLKQAGCVEKAPQRWSLRVDPWKQEQFRCQLEDPSFFLPLLLPVTPRNEWSWFFFSQPAAQITSGQEVLMQHKAVSRKVKFPGSIANVAIRGNTTSMRQDRILQKTDLKFLVGVFVYFFPKACGALFFQQNKFLA